MRTQLQHCLCGPTAVSPHQPACGRARQRATQAARAGAFCNGLCGCCACLNTVANAPLVMHVRQCVLSRAPLAFLPKARAQRLRGGCLGSHKAIS